MEVTQIHFFAPIEKNLITSTLIMTFGDLHRKLIFTVLLLLLASQFYFSYEMANFNPLSFYSRAWPCTNLVLPLFMLLHFTKVHFNSLHSWKQVFFSQNYFWWSSHFSFASFVIKHYDRFIFVAKGDIKIETTNTNAGRLIYWKNKAK